MVDTVGVFLGVDVLTEVLAFGPALVLGLVLGFEVILGVVDFGVVTFIVESFVVVFDSDFLILVTVWAFFCNVVSSLLIRVCSFFRVEFSDLYDSAVDFRLL